MKQISTLLIAAFALCFSACTNHDKAGDTMAAKKVSSLSPYKAVLMQFTAGEGDTMPGFVSDSMMKASGLSSYAVARGLEDDKKVTVMGTVSDLQKAKNAFDDRAMRDTLAKLGVPDPFMTLFLNVSFDDTSTIPQMERLMVTDKVKDYDAFNKVLKSVNDSIMANSGLTMRLMAQNADDSNTVILFFAITDMAKAKAWQDSPELKKIMADGGVTDRKLSWFKWVRM